jgi:hypothetical protein
MPREPRADDHLFDSAAKDRKTLHARSAAARSPASSTQEDEMIRMRWLALALLCTATTQEIERDLSDPMAQMGCRNPTNCRTSEGNQASVPDSETQNVRLCREKRKRKRKRYSAIAGRNGNATEKQGEVAPHFPQQLRRFNLERPTELPPCCDETPPNPVYPRMASTGPSAAQPSLAGLVYPDIGGYLLGRMGVHASRKDGGIGKAMVWRAKRIAQQSGAGGAFLAVDPKDDALIGYYAKFGFLRLDPSGVRRRMILSLR